jgi:hypothetical protein
LKWHEPERKKAEETFIASKTTPILIAVSEANLKIFISAVVALGLLYAVDSYFFRGKYLAATSRMFFQITSQFR